MKKDNNTISLTHKQNDILRQEVDQLKRTLSDIVVNAKENDRLFDKTKGLILALMDVKTLADYCQVLFSHLTDSFGVSHYQLHLFDYEKKIDIPHLCVDSSATAENKLGALFNPKSKYQLGLFREKELGYLFPNVDSKEIKSAALLLITDQKNTIIGLLSLGSLDPDYYHHHLDTLFIDFLLEVIKRQIPGLVHGYGTV